MAAEPLIASASLLRAVREHYGLEPHTLTFLPGGTAPAYRAEGPQGRWFLKVVPNTPYGLDLLGRVRAEVPLRYSFDAGSSTVKPPLAAVLDRLGTSQRGGKSRLLVVAPGDPKRAGNLATDRAGSARDYLVAKGIAATRFTISGVPEPDVVRIVVSEAGPPRLP